MAQESVAPDTAQVASGDEHSSKGQLLGPLLCWAVVFADIGTSVYYTPGVLYQTVQGLAGFFVFLTMSAFILLSLKYVEITHRFPQGGGVVTVAAQAMNHWVGALGGMFILIDYFLTAAISALSGMQYLSVVIVPLAATVAIPGFGSVQLAILILSIVILVLLGILNWVGVSESAKVSLIGAVIAFASDIAILVTVFSHLSLGEFFTLIEEMFQGHPLDAGSLLAGFAGAFLAFSGLESISQLSPVMRKPHKRVAGIAMMMVVLTIGITSPLLTMLSTLLLPEAARNPEQSAYIISLLAGRWGGTFLQIEVAISASALLVFASNTAIIGAYHVFMALSRMGFLPAVVLKRNKLRDTPHFSIMLATGIPILILIAVLGNITVLGEMYAFGLLGAFALTCIGLDLVRYQDIKRARTLRNRNNPASRQNEANGHHGSHHGAGADVHDLIQSSAIGTASPPPNGAAIENSKSNALIKEVSGWWFKVKFGLGIITTLMVVVAWITNLYTKHLATIFGVTLTVLGMGLAYLNYRMQKKQGVAPVPVAEPRIEPLPNSILAVLLENNPHNEAVIQAAVNNGDRDKPITFLYLTQHKPRPVAPRMMEIVDPYLEDQQARQIFGKAENLILQAKLPNRRYVYLQAKPSLITQIWQYVHPRDIILAVEDEEQLKDINPDRIRYETTANGKVIHLLKRW
jgi:amino acid transporter